MKTFTILELLELASKTDSLDVLKFVNKLADIAAEEQAEELRALEEEAMDRGSIYDQYPAEFA